MKTTKHGYSYYELQDMKEICGKCRYSYDGDWTVVDCDYCRLPKALKLMEEMAKELEREHLVSKQFTDSRNAIF